MEKTEEARLSPGEALSIDAYWRAANYLSVGQIYLLDNPLLKEPLELKHEFTVGGLAGALGGKR